MKTKRIVPTYIGRIGVDTGLCWIGDPSNILHANPTPKAIGKDWDEFCEILDANKQYPTCTQFNYDLGHAGLGVVVSTGYGDGFYPVYVEVNDEGRVAKVCVEFIKPDDERNSTEERNQSTTMRKTHRHKIDESSFGSVVEAAGLAFWDVVARRFPQAKTGDLSPSTSLKLTIAVQNAVEEWIDLNVPSTASKGD